MREFFWIVFTMALIPFGIGVYLEMTNDEEKGFFWIKISLIWIITCALFGPLLVTATSN